MRPGPNNDSLRLEAAMRYPRDQGGYVPNPPYQSVDIEAAARGHGSPVSRHRDQFAVQRLSVGGYITVAGQDNYRTLFEAAADAYDRFLVDGCHRRVIDVNSRMVVWPYKDKGTWA